MLITHVFSNSLSELTGTVTVFNSAAQTITLPASSLVGVSEWNSAHNLQILLGGNTLNTSSLSATAVTLAAGPGIYLSGTGSTVSIVQSTLSAWAANLNAITGMTTSNVAATLPRIVPVGPNIPLTISTLQVPFSFAYASSTASSTASFLFAAGLYSLTNTTYTSSVQSSMTLSLAVTGVSLTATVSQPGTSTSYAMAAIASFNGSKWIGMKFVASVAPGVPNILAFSYSSAGGGGVGGSLLVASAPNFGLLNISQGAGVLNSNTVWDRWIGGVATVSTAALPGSYASNAMQSTAGGFIYEMIAS